jgi:hypothetical protein
MGYLCLITIGKTFFWLISRFIVLQLRGLFQEHLSPHQFGVLIPRGCETILFGIRALCNLHLDWVMMQVNIENAFNSVSRATILRELQDVEGLLANIVPFTKLFYGVHSSFYYQHGQHEEGFIAIESSSGMRQGDPPRWSFICPSPLSSMPKGHCVIPQLCLSILSRL